MLSLWQPPGGGACHPPYPYPKVGRILSDEFMVLLCRSHHRLVHRVAGEMEFWTAHYKELGRSPLAKARELWAASHPRRTRQPCRYSPRVPRTRRTCLRENLRINQSIICWRERIDEHQAVQFQAILKVFGKEVTDAGASCRCPQHSCE